jgi:hypothetical protein
MKINEILSEDYKTDQRYDNETDHNSPQFQPNSIKSPHTPGATPVKTNEEIVAIIEANCSEVLAAYRKQGECLWRGVKEAGDPVIISDIRQHRLPVQMSQEAHYALDRSNSIFCSARTSIAMAWGSVYAVFPKNGWSGTIFNTQVDDYNFYELQSAARQYIGTKNFGMLVDQIKDMEPEVITPANLGGVLSEQFADVLITGSSYIGIKYGNKKLFEMLGINLT